MKLKKLLLLSAILISGLVATAQTNKTGYYPLEIKNNSGASTNVKNVYVTLMGSSWNTAQTNCVLSLTYDSIRNAQVATMVPITSQSDAKDYTYDITALKGYNQTTATVRIYVPHLQSGRCMISVNYKLYMPASQAADMTWSFLAPSVSDTSDINNDIIYDKFEYTYDTIAPTGKFWINTTAVDFLSIPMKLSLNGSASGNVSEISRPAIFKIVSDTLTTYDNSLNKTWTSLIVADQSPIRITSPSLGPIFNSTYLDDTSSYNYILNLIKQYSTDTLYIDCSEVSGSWYGGTIDSTRYWVFTGTHNGINDTVKINMNTLVSDDFFAPGTSPFDTPNTTIKSILVKNITAAFTVNFLPAANNDSLVKPYNSANFYLNNPLQNAPANSGPWYNLYTRAVHAAIPIIYAFAYDDVLGQDGELSCTDTTKPALISICDFGNTIIPPHKDLLHVGSVLLLTNTGFVNNGSTSTIRVTWQNPPIPGVGFPQPSNALYYIMPSGSTSFGYTISADSIFKLQKGHFGKYTDTCMTLTLPTSCLTGNPAQMTAQIMTFGGPESPADGTDTQILNNAHGSNMLSPNVAKPKCTCSTSPKPNPKPKCNLQCKWDKFWCWLLHCEPA